MALVIDTGVLYAALDTAQPRHRDCLEILETDERRVIPGPVLVELDYWLGKGAPHDWLKFCRTIDAGMFDIQPTTPSLLIRAAEVQRKYADLRLGFVDASVFVTCEALGEDKVATLDHRDFGVLKTKAGKVLRLLPE